MCIKFYKLRIKSKYAKDIRIQTIYVTLYNEQQVQVYLGILTFYRKIIIYFKYIYSNNTTIFHFPGTYTKNI